MKEITNDQADKLIILSGYSKLFEFIFGRMIRKLASRLINRGFERGYLSSHAYHEMHAMNDRVFKP